MKKNFLLTALVAAASVLSASAEVLTPYTEQFENPTERPKGWLRGGASSYSQGTYKVVETGGHSDGYISVNQYSNYYSSYYNNYNYNDLLITPKVEGDLSIWVRKNGTEPTLTFFNIANPAAVPTSANEFVRIEGTELNLVADKEIDDWTKITVEGVPAGTYVGIRAHNLDLDEFTATSAEVLYRPSLVVSVSNQSGGTTLNADLDNQVTFKFKVSIENNGDIDFAASDEGFKIDLVNYTADNALFGSGNITEAIPCGTTVEKEFSMTGTPVIAAGTVSNNYRVVISHALTNSIEASLGYFTVIPYLPAPKFMFFETNSSNQSSYNDVNITDVITIGAGEAGTSRTLWMWNSGTAPMVVSSINVAEGFSVDVESFTLEAGEKQELTVSLTGDPGLKSGSITFVDAVLGEISYDLVGYVSAPGEYAQDFEGEGAPEGMVVGKNWTVKDAPVALQPLAGLKYVECPTSYTEKIVTPLLAFNEGDKITFMATKTDNTSSKLNVYTSTDRVNWTLAKAITASVNADRENGFNVDKPTGTGYGTYEFKLFDIDMPAGEVYVAFEAGGVRLDNICGGQQVEVAHDPYVVTVGLPDVGQVNTRYIANITLRNLLAKAESDYSVVLEVNGEQVAAAAETPELGQGEEASYELRFTPHTEGDFSGAFVFLSGSDRIVLSQFDFTVGAEKAESTYQVGDVKITSTEPLNTFYNAQGQVIYRADQLGMDAGVKIIGFTFNGYNTAELSKNVKVWIQNTDVEAYEPGNIVAAAKADMTLVYDGEYTFPVVGNSAAKIYEPLFVIPFSVPFTYEGKSLRIMIEQTNLTDDADTHNVFLTIDNSVYDYWNDVYDNRVITNNKSYAEDLDDEPSWNIYRAGFPVTYFSVAKDVVVAKGNVTNDFGQPVKNAVVKYTSDDILYQSVTDADGNYSMNIANVGLTYELTAEAKDYDLFALENQTFNAEESLEHVADIVLNYLDRTATLSGTVRNSLDGNKPLAGVEVTLTAANGDAVSALTDEDGRYSVVVPELADTYAIDVTADGDTQHHVDAYTFASKAETMDFRVAVSSIADVVGNGLSVSVSGNVITVIAPAGTAVSVYNMTGASVGRAVSNGSAMSFGPLAPGVYVAAGVKVAIR